MHQKSLFGVEYEIEKKDVQYTPDDVAKYIVDFFQPEGKILDPCKGDGAFLRHMPGAEWCELREGRDFFDFDAQVDWIVSNPPYSIFSEWLDHSFEIAENIVYLIPINKPFNSFSMLQRVAEYGGIKHVLAIAPGAKLKFSIGFAIGAIHFKRGWHGKMGFSFRSANKTINVSANRCATLL